MFEGLAGSAAAGPAACLLAASLWAVSVTLYSGPIRSYGAADVNLAKTAIASLLLGSTALLSGQLGQLVTAPGWAVGTVALSGFVGMTLGDTALFAAVDRIGVHRTLLLQTVAPIVAALLSYLLYQERLTSRELSGAVVVLVGVAVVVVERRGAAGALRSSVEIRWPVFAAGLGFALCAAAGQGTGVVLSKVGMTELGFLPASFVRLSVACSALAVARLGRRAIFGGVRGRAEVFSRTGLRRVVLPSVVGSYVAILLMMVGISMSPAGIAAVLLATTPIFSLFVEARMTRRPLTPRSVLGTLLAVAGVGILSTGG